MRLTVNGRLREVAIPPEATLLELLRDGLALTGSKLVCDRGECGACTVLLDGETAYACLTLAAACDGATVVTAEGLAEPESPAGLSALQRAFIAHDAAQCGFCTPGQLVAAHALLQQTPHPTDLQIRDAMSGNLCRCGTYPKILTAIRAVAAGDFADGADAA
ncbi:MAG: (2Fe-2S)-binding protein [Gemmatimonadales bacterium]